MANGALFDGMKMGLQTLMSLAADIPGDHLAGPFADHLFAFDRGPAQGPIRGRLTLTGKAGTDP